MAEIDEKVVRHVANLAKLQFSDDEIGDFTHKLSKIVEYVEKLNELDTNGVEPTFHILDVCNKFRKDEVIVCSSTKDELLSNAPSSVNGCFEVPDIVE